MRLSPLALALLLPVGIAAGPPVAPGDLAVMSFNIRYGTANDGPNHWNNRRDLLIQVIREAAPDVLGVQEALRFQLDQIQAAFPQYGEVGVGRDDGRTAGEYSAILYRTDRLEVATHGTFWFSDTPEVPGSMSWGNRITRICTWARMRDRATGRWFYVYNLHLDHQSQPSRERSVDLLGRRIAQRETDDPVLITGDFNAGESNAAIRFLTGGQLDSASVLVTSARPTIRLVDSYRVRHPQVMPAGTFNGFTGAADGEKIDYIIVSPEWRVLAADIVRTNIQGRYPSDHFPVTAVVRLER